ncbi:MAG: hypothetical protein ACREQM_21605, partial [Candidatus Dormibacteraceae bacterium]
MNDTIRSLAVDHDRRAMATIELLEELERHGVCASVRDGRLVTRPKGGVPAHLVPELIGHKAELIALLAERAADRDAAVGSPSLLGIDTKIATFRPAQEAALDWIEQSHSRFLLLDAPTGSGKSLIGRAAGAVLQQRAAYLATDKGLQRQFTAAFGDSAELMGRGNYRRPEWLEGITCEDCTWTPKHGCSWCGADREGCPYQIAKATALEAPFAVLNTAYFLTEANHGGAFSREGQLVVIDEADTLEDEVLRQVAVSLDDKALQEMGGLSAPCLGEEPQWAFAAWEAARGIASQRRRVVDFLREADEKPRELARAQRQAERWTGLARRLGALAEDLKEDPRSWVRRKTEEPTPGQPRPPVEFDPVYVRKYAAGRLWRHGGRFLLMSATLLAPEVLARELGIPDGEWDYLQLDSDFPAERRPVYFRPVASMAYRHRERSLPLLVDELDGLLDRYSGRVLVHSQTFGIGRSVVARSRHRDRFVLYEGGGRDDGVERYKSR